MNEELLVTARANDLIDPSLHIWTWEVAMYLFLGGVTAGIMIFAAAVALMKRDETAPFAATRLALLAPIVLSLGMTTLFLDLEHKLYVFRFYTTFRVLSPMSWGAWILLIIYPVSFLQILSTLRRGVPQAGEFMDRLAVGRAIIDWCERYRREISLVALPAGVLLGVYTAILLSAFSARPFWNTGVLAPLFLVSGLSTAAALVALLTRDHGERAWFTRIDIVLIILELVLVALFLINLATGSAKQIEALECCVMGGPYTFAFWVLFVGIGLLIPLVLEIMEMRGLGKPLALAAAVLVLFGGYTLRHVMVEVGQESTWTRYPTQYNAELLERLDR
jgi:formate-dependent nitrite reductase membrane component NrfD